MNSKKYILKPGKHQFTPGEHARHDNESLTDAEAEWYLERYPHISKLFVEKLEGLKVETLLYPTGLKLKKTVKGIRKNTATPQPSNFSTLQHSNDTNENLPPTN